MALIFLCILCFFIPAVLITFAAIVLVYLQKQKSTDQPEKFEEAEFRDA